VDSSKIGDGMYSQGESEWALFQCGRALTMFLASCFQSMDASTSVMKF
jgi:hypothetical protein